VRDPVRAPQRAAQPPAPPGLHRHPGTPAPNHPSPPRSRPRRSPDHATPAEGPETGHRGGAANPSQHPRPPPPPTPPRTHDPPAPPPQQPCRVQAAQEVTAVLAAAGDTASSHQRTTGWSEGLSAHPVPGGAVTGHEPGAEQTRGAAAPEPVQQVPGQDART